ncbi:MAG: hypothetical protein GY754_19930 [bacterium]|nr:hypothetical protein [bacterium]
MIDNDIVLITNEEELAYLVDALIENEVVEIGLDFEGESNLHRYGIHLCLIQLFDGEYCYIIDPVEIKDISRIRWIFENKYIQKIMYSADFDVRLLRYTYNYELNNIFDIQIGAKILQYTDVSLKQMITSTTKIDVEKSKQEQKSNWNRRPLTERQIKYAAGDVRYLLEIKDKIYKDLVQSGEIDLFNKKNRILEKVKFQEKKEPHLVIKNSKKLGSLEQVFLKNYFHARDAVAQKLDFPPYWVLNNHKLLEISEDPPLTKDDWLNIKGLSVKAYRYVDMFINATKNSEEETGVCIETRDELQDDSQTEAQPDIQVDPQDDHQTEAQPDIQVDREDDSQTETQPDIEKINPQDDYHPEEHNELKTEAQPDIQVDPQDDSQTETQPDIQVDEQDDSQTETQPDIQVDPQDDHQTETQADIQVDEQDNSQTETQADK